MGDENISMKKVITELFDNVSAVFDSSGPRFFAYFGEGLVNFAGIKEGDKVLDAAAGKGASLFPSTEKAGPSGEVIGIDIAEGMVKETNFELRLRDIKNAKVMIMDAERLLFADETFDHILCGFAVFFFPNYKAAFAEFMRVLKSNGKLSFTTFSDKKDEKFTWYGEIVEKYLPPSEDKPEEEDGPEFDTEEGLHKLLNEAGFKNIQVICEDKTFQYKNEQEWWDKQWSHGGIRVMKAIPKDRMADFKSEIFERLKVMKEAGGIISTMSVLYAAGEK